MRSDRIKRGLYVLTATNLIASLAFGGQDSRSAPEWMPARTVECIQRLSPQVDTMVVSEGTRVFAPERPVALSLIDVQLPIQKRRLIAEFGRCVDQWLYENTLEDLHLIAGKEVQLLKTSQLLLSLCALSRYKPVDIHAENHYDAISIHIFKEDKTDPARALWEALRSDPSVDTKRIAGTDVLCRKVEFNTGGSDSFFYWSPRPRVAVVVRRERLLEDTVRRWTIQEAGPGPFPWEDPAWDMIPRNTTTWGIRLDPPVFTARRVVLTVDEKHDPAAILLSLEGAADIDFGIPMSPQIVSRTAGRNPRLTVRIRPNATTTGILDSQVYTLQDVISRCFLPGVNLLPK